jgi:carboxyl-terminal processing protease
MPFPRSATILLAWLLIGSGLVCLSTPARAQDAGSRATEDLAFALDTLEEKCGHFFSLKDIDWRQVRREMEKRAKDVESDADHFALMVRLLARLKDGHAAVKKGPNWSGDFPRPEEWAEKRVSSGLMFCRIGKKLYIRNSWSSARDVGLEPGMEVVKVDGTSAMKWFGELIEETRDTRSLPTPQRDFYITSRWGFQRPPGTRVKFEVKVGGKKKKRTLTFDRAKSYIEGPAVLPTGVRWAGDSVRWGKTPGGFGYINVRYIKGDVVSGLDQALGNLKDAPGLVLDFRGNSGGGCDHDAFEARFVPLGEKKLPRIYGDPLAGAGPNPYGGPMVVIVDGSVVSAGETTSGMFKENSRGWMIGDAPTAGASSQKETIELPSGNFSLYVSVRSNRRSYNGGRGIEGIGVAPQEVVEYDPGELANGVDTLIRRADELLEDFPQAKVKYDPKEYGWSPE